MIVKLLTFRIVGLAKRGNNMANIQERITKDGKKVFRVRVRIKGYPLQTATFDKKTDAKLWGKQTEIAIIEGKHFKSLQSKRYTLNDLIQRYVEEALPLKPKSYKDQKQQLEVWRKEIGHLTLQEVTPSVITAFRNKLSVGKTNRGIRSKATVNRYLAVMSHAFTIAMKEWEWVSENPVMKVSRLKESRGRVRFLSDTEREALLFACKESDNKYLYSIVVLTLSTGARKNEILQLKWKNIDFDRQVITLHETKNGERRLLPLHGYAYELISGLCKNRIFTSEYLFPSDRTDKPVDIKKSWETSIKKAGIENFRFHDLRHSTASYLAMDGASMTDIAEVLGHKTLQMVKRYAHLSEAHTSKVVASMNEKIFSTKPLKHSNIIKIDDVKNH